ncbi:MAG TPA: type II toxin-antitoxin system HicA family toxin [Candidatus Angelobacter sp.]|jgi:predicted RNA binding protein YcfA (HicA-like mRNA interferase family)|nr:type II toxin-antitoxin system HicA family toxin [Candidatus Angelobacter sp.]
MARLTPLPWQKLVCIFEQVGYKQAGQKGSHIKMEKQGVARPLIIPRYDSVGLDIIKTLMRTADNMSRDEFLERLDKC